jgi:hypothetical protein
VTPILNEALSSLQRAQRRSLLSQALVGVGGGQLQRRLQRQIRPADQVSAGSW